MAVSKRSRQLEWLRPLLVISYMLLSAGSIAAAFALCWFRLSGAVYFLLCGTFLALWASVTATCSRIVASDLLGMAKLLGGKSLPQSPVAD
ncbi:MAG: hypothetical protein JNL58_16800 [Planctomyces sp.]|nr:hypothetical protein [Planctomyces sp.]